MGLEHKFELDVRVGSYRLWLEHRTLQIQLECGLLHFVSS